ncbi:MAG TPA: hypothetical protein VNV87_00820 [Acidimicrobiales bacterium]|nr:hypothetical protein [Acidimicrobiales bacterium]
MTRCDHCGVAFASAYQEVIDAVTRDVASVHTEMCPAGHVLDYEEGDYYLV